MNYLEWKMQTTVGVVDYWSEADLQARHRSARQALEAQILQDLVTLQARMMRIQAIQHYTAAEERLDVIDLELERIKREMNAQHDQAEAQRTKLEEQQAIELTWLRTHTAPFKMLSATAA